MWYYVVFGILAVWVFIDARQRKNKALLMSIGTFILGPIVLPFYLAQRNLKAGEVREGGTGWNVMKNFALIWSITMLIAIGAAMSSASDVVQQAGSEAEQAGAAIGATLGLGAMIGLWFFVLVGALVIGLFLKKSSVVEKGPTGALAELQEKQE